MSYLYWGHSHHPLGPVGLTLTAPPAEEPLDLADAKAHLRVDVTDDDALIEALIAAAREYAETYCNRALITQEWTLTMDDFPRAPSMGLPRPREFHVPKPRLQSVASITYIAPDGTTQTLDPTTYLVDVASLQGRVALAHACVWPVVLHQANSVAVAFTAGYGAAADVPKGIVQAMLLLVGHWYEAREAVIISTGRALVAEVPMTVDALLSMHRVVEF